MQNQTNDNKNSQTSPPPYIHTRPIKQSTRVRPAREIAEKKMRKGQHAPSHFCVTMYFASSRKGVRYYQSFRAEHSCSTDGSGNEVRSQDLIIGGMNLTNEVKENQISLDT